MLTLAPTTANAASASTPTNRGGQAADRTPVVPEETTPTVIQRRDTDTLSLYEQAGLSPSKRVQRLVAADLAASEAPVVASAVPGAYDSNGNVLPPGLKSHVDTFCGGTGTDGTRVQVMYVREADQSDRYAQVAPILRNEMHYIDDAFAVSSQETGGGKRVRWVHDGSCNLSVLNVVLPDGSITGTHSKTEAALNTAGYLEANRKYLAFADVPMGGLGGSACGQGTVYDDTNPTDNLNDGRYPQMARIDLECWVTDSRYNAAPLHEFLHTLGAVMPGAPHGSAGFHCTDGAETMCYNDGTATVQAVCPDTMKYDIDCNDDDYFNTNPSAGSYLATHWNTANSPFLETVPQLAAPPTVSVTASNRAPETGDVVTFSANVPAGTEVMWSTDVPACENTGAAKTGTTFSIQCFDTYAPTVTASASYPTGYTASTVDTPVAYTQGPYPTLAITAPTSSPVGKAFTLSANVENAKTAWTYQWTNRTAGCTISAGAASATMTATCDSAVLNQFGTFSVDATRTADGSKITDTAGVKITSAGAPTVTIDGPPSVKVGTSATFTATVENATSPTFAWSSLSNYGSSTSSSVTVTVPTTAADGTDTLYLTVTSSTGEKTTLQYTYGIEGAPRQPLPPTLRSADTATGIPTAIAATGSHLRDGERSRSKRARWQREGQRHGDDAPELNRMRGRARRSTESGAVQDRVQVDVLMQAGDAVSPTPPDRCRSGIGGTRPWPSPQPPRRGLAAHGKARFDHADPRPPGGPHQPRTRPGAALGPSSTPQPRVCAANAAPHSSRGSSRPASP